MHRERGIMLNPEKIRLMTKISIADKRYGSTMRDISRYFSSDYISKKVLKALIHYSLCFVLLVMIVMVGNMQEILQNINLPGIEKILHLMVTAYCSGLAVTIVIAYACYSYIYNTYNEKAKYYKAALDKLYRLADGESGDFEVTDEEIRYYRETGGAIRLYNDRTRRWEIIEDSITPVLKVRERKRFLRKELPETEIPAEKKTIPPERKAPESYRYDHASDETRRRRGSMVREAMLEETDGWLDDPIMPSISMLDFEDEPVRRTTTVQHPEASKNVKRKTRKT